MKIDAQHPQYVEFIDKWRKLRDSYAGEDAIKERGVTYLPATSGQILDGMNQGAGSWNTQSAGYLAYKAYMTRAIFPSYVDDAVKMMIGAMHGKPADIQLPPVMAPLIESATPQGESLLMLLRRINEAQLVTGRVGLIADLMPGAALPHLATYDAERIINWDDDENQYLNARSLNLVVLDECGNRRVNYFEWRSVKAYRVLVLGGIDENEQAAAYRQALVTEDENGNLSFEEAQLIEPSIRGNMLRQIPFVFVNATDLLADVLNPPLLGLANISLAIYRGEADYRHSLFMQGQDTLIIKDDNLASKQASGLELPPLRTGANAAIFTPTAGGAEYVGVKSSGLAEQRQALENDRRVAEVMSGRLIDMRSRQKEGADTLRIRVAAQTATLNQIALAGAAGLQSILRLVAEWLGANPDEVTVTPNLEFAEAGMTADDFLKLSQAKANGLPLSTESLHTLLVENDLTVKDFEDEALALADERGMLLDLLPAPMPPQPGVQ